MRPRDAAPRRASDARPSPVSRDRLAARVERDVADVRTRLEEAVLRQDALLASGQPDRAAAVVDEQHALMDELREQVEASVAAAIVEAEAESVLAAAPDSAQLFGPVEDPADDVVEVVELRPRRSLRVAASAALSAMAALALLVMAGSPPEPGTLAAAGVDDEASGGLAERSAEEDGAAPSRDGLASADARAIGPNELEVRELFASPGPDDRTERRRGLGFGVANGLGELQSLVDSLVATVVRAADAARSVTGTDEIPVFTDAAEEADHGDGDEAGADAADDEARSTEATTDEPAAEPAGEEPADEEPDDEGGLPERDVLGDQVSHTGLGGTP